MANTQVKLDFQKALPFGWGQRFFTTRNRILDRWPSVRVAPLDVPFFEGYADGVDSPTQIESSPELTTEIRPREASPNRQAKMGIMYSGGSESVYMDQIFCSSDLVTVTNLVKNKWKTEFQLALAGLSLGYPVTMIGVGIGGDPEDEVDFANKPPDGFEYTDDFINLWNARFPETTIQYPLMLMPKDEVYKSLLAQGQFLFKWCDENPIAPCGKCWKCAEAHFTFEAIGHKSPVPMDQDFLNKMRFQHQEHLRDGVDPYGSLAYLHRLRRVYDYHGWLYSVY